MAIDLDCTAARLQLEELESRSQALADGRLALQLLLQEQLGIDSTPQTTDILQSLLNASEEQQLQEQITSLSQFIAVAEGQQAALDSVAEEEAQQAASLQLATALQAQEEWDATVLRPHDAALARAIAGCTRAEWNEQGQMLQKPLDLTGRPTEPHDSKAAFRKACSTGKASGHTPAQDSTREPAGLSSGAAASASNSCQAGDLRAQCSSGSSSGTHSTGSGYVRQLMDALDGAVEPCERSEVEDIIRELYDEQLLPQREVKLLAERSLRGPGKLPKDVTLQGSPRLFRQLLEASIVKSLQLTQPEIHAKGIATNTVVQLLLQGSRKGVLQLQGYPVTIDRVAVAGSVGKRVCVPGQFDIDMVAFVNLPRQAGISIDLYDPDKTAGSQWMQDLMQQLCSFLQKELAACSSKLQCTKQPSIGNAAITFRLKVHTAEDASFELGVDVLLAPNLAGGAGADAAAAAAAAAPGLPPCSSSSSSSGKAAAPADVQCRAVLAPVLALADSVLNGRASRVWSQQEVQPAYVRSIWLAEAATEFVQQAGVAAGTSRSGLSGRVVTSTIRLVKSWVRTGLQPSRPGFRKLRSFMIELLVLHAAERFASQQAEGFTQQWGGRYVLDLLLEALVVAQEWAADADARGMQGSSAATGSTPILFTGLASSKYYSRQQAEALQQLAQRGRWPGHEGLFKARPVVIHPVEPLCNVFDQQERFRFKLWEVLGKEARQLQLQLQHGTWGEVEQHSTLRFTLGFVSSTGHSKCGVTPSS